MRKSVSCAALGALLSLLGCAAKDTGPCITYAPPAAGAPVTTGTLLGELTDLAALTRRPDPPFTTRQFSSNDRAARSPQENWFANADHGKFLREEDRAGRHEYVLMDAEGPGAIVRIWSANPAGTLRFYFDGAAEPELEVQMVDLLSGKVTDIPAPIAHTASAGWNCYYPLPYARRCVVTCDAGKFYYHVNYRTYDAQTTVVTFTAPDLGRYAAQAQKLATALATAGTPAAAWTPETCAEARQERHTARLKPGAVRDWKLRAGDTARAVTMLSAQVTADDLNVALRHLVLRAEFDGQLTVVCPLGDFFGAAPGLNPYRSLPLEARADGTLVCRWVMPYQHAARFSLENLGEMPAEVALEITTAPYAWTERSLYFHAQWRAAHDVPTRPMSDWQYLQTAGPGVFVGAAFAIANPARAWWGEGDEKIYVDGEAFPSHFGTGTEDYYGYAWGSPQLFSHAFHSQPRCDGPGNYGHTAVNRWHVIDKIPFERDFRFDMELWHWWEGVLPAISVATYWYAAPGVTHTFTEPDADALALVSLPRYEPPRVHGALEGEELKIISHTSIAERQEIERCSNEAHLWWRDGRPGDRLVVAFDVAGSGRYAVYARFVQAPDYGMHRLLINDLEVVPQLDLYHEKVIVGEERKIGELALHSGENRLTIEVTGANPQAQPRHMAGLDYLRLEPLP